MIMEPAPVAVPEEQQCEQKPVGKTRKQPTKRAEKKPEKAENVLKSTQDLRKFFQKRVVEKTAGAIPCVGIDVIADADLNAPVIEANSVVEMSPENSQDKTTPQPSNECTKRHRKLNRWLQSKKPLIKNAQPFKDITELLLSEALSKPAKLLVLKQHGTFINEIRKQMKVLLCCCCVGIDEELVSMSPEEQRIRQIYQKLIELYGSQAVLNAMDTTDRDQSVFKQDIGDLEALVAQRFRSEMAKATDCIFKGLEEPNFCCNNFDFVCEQLKALDHETKAHAKTHANFESMVYDAFNDHNELNIGLDSKYQSQIPQLTNNPDLSAIDETNDDSFDNWLALQSYFPEEQQSINDESSLANTTMQSDASIKERNSSSCRGFIRADDGLIPQLQPQLQPQPMHSSTPFGVDKSTNYATKNSRRIAAAQNEHEMELSRNAAEPIESIKSNAANAAREHAVDINIDIDLNFDLDDFIEPLPEEKLLSQAKPTDNDKTMSSPAVSIASGATTPDLSPSILNKLCTLLSERERSGASRGETTAPRTTPEYYNKCSSKPPSMGELKETKKRPAVKRKLIESDTDMEAEPAEEEPLTTCESFTRTTRKTTRIARNSSPDIFEESQMPTADLETPTTCSQLSRLRAAAVTRSLSTNPNESTIFLAKRGGQAKRKFLESDSEEEQPPQPRRSLPNDKENAQKDNDNDELIAATQFSEGKTRQLRQRKKRRKLNPFIQFEAAQSGSEATSADDETICKNAKDSIIMSSDDNNTEDEADRSRVQVLYLQAYKSQHVRHAFKIPAKRDYNDEADIFSQPVCTSQPSQYLADSFVIDENAEASDCEAAAVAARDETLCPLERAERILKERRRNKRRCRINGSESPARKRVRKARLISSSEEDET